MLTSDTTFHVFDTTEVSTVSFDITKLSHSFKRPSTPLRCIYRVLSWYHLRRYPHRFDAAAALDRHNVLIVTAYDSTVTPFDRISPFIATGFYH